MMLTKIRRFSKLTNVYNCSYFTIRTKAEQKNINQLDDSVCKKCPRGADTPQITGKVGGRYYVTMAKGVGIGPELMDLLKEVFYCVNAPVMFEELEIADKESEDDMNNLILSVLRNGVAVKANIENGIQLQGTPKNLELNQRLDLYVNLMEFKSYPGIKHRNKMGQEIDISLVRQNTEGEFAMLEHDVGAAVEHLKVTTRHNTDRLARFAFKYAVKNNRKRVVTVFNEGFHEEGEDLFRNCCEKVAEEYPQIAHKVQSIGSFLRRNSWLDFKQNVVIASCIGGEMISNIIGGYIGGAALVCGCNYGDIYAVFETSARQRGLKIKGRNIANPTAVLMTGVNLLRYLEQHTHADIIESAVKHTINVDQVLTQDMGGNATTRDMTDNIKKEIKKSILTGHCDK